MHVTPSLSMSKLTAQSSMRRNLESPINMLLLQQSGSLKLGEVIRYTITYIPSQDRMLPLPTALYLKIKNNCSAALRAAFMRGPYNISVAVYPATFNPNEDFKNEESLGVPYFEPNLRAAGTWSCVLKVPEKLQASVAGRREAWSIKYKHEDTVAENVTWIVEVASQVVFSASAAVHFEVLLGRHEKCLSLDSPTIPKNLHRSRSCSFQSRRRQQSSHTEELKSPARLTGIFSKSIKLKVEDTDMLWSKPCLPVVNEADENPGSKTKSKKEVSETKNMIDAEKAQRSKQPRKFHLVILTHGLHSNIGADMLYLKESIDATAKQARIDAKELRRKSREEEREKNKRERTVQEFYSNQRSNNNMQTNEVKQPQDEELDESEDEEGVVVRGFSGNAAQTEKGIKYLGKRLARYVLAMTYPDQPFESHRKKYITHVMRTESSLNFDAEGSSHKHKKVRAYKFSSISFIGHSLGGLVQTYAVAYIQKHWPIFFDEIKPINFIALATPFLGLNNENPTYVKFALNFGLVGRTGQDLGLTWLAPTIAKSGWDALVGGISESSSKSKEQDGDCPPETKPLLQILPLGPAHTALKKFKKRTVYSNVVNDGIVPLRTSCLLFVDWQGLGKIEKARRESSLMGTVAEWGWAEITGANSASASPLSAKRLWAAEINGKSEEKRELDSNEVLPKSPCPIIKVDENQVDEMPESGLMAGFIKLLQPSKTSSKVFVTPKQPILDTPPRTSLLESAGDLLKPPLPTEEYILNFSSRPQTIYHDRVYYPCDIPVPRPAKRSANKEPNHHFSFFLSPSDALFDRKEFDPKSPTSPDEDSHDVPADTSPMKIEEKIARAYHRDLSWRKVLVRLEPDAHNNIIVRRMFPNAYGWPVVKHLCDAHFSDSALSSPHDDNLYSHLDVSDELSKTVVDVEDIHSRLGLSDRDDTDTDSEDEVESKEFQNM